MLINFSFAYGFVEFTPTFLPLRTQAMLRITVCESKSCTHLSAYPPHSLYFSLWLIQGNFEIYQYANLSAFPAHLSTVCQIDTFHLLFFSSHSRSEPLWTCPMHSNFSFHYPYKVYNHTPKNNCWIPHHLKTINTALLDFALILKKFTKH